MLFGSELIFADPVPQDIANSGLKHFNFGFWDGRHERDTP
jgi:hypothetical protein